MECMLVFILMIFIKKSIMPNVFLIIGKMNHLTICGDYICEVLSELSIFDHHERSMFLRLQVPVSFEK